MYLFVVGGHLIGKGMQSTYDDTLSGGGTMGFQDFSIASVPLQ